MTHINDDILVATGGPTVFDGLLTYYQTNGATSNHLRDAEYEFLIAQGVIAAAIPDMWYEFLIGKGYSGSIVDMYKQFWADGGIIITYIPPYFTEAVSFDGINDAVNRATEYTGNVDGKLGIFSCWFDLVTFSNNDKIYMSQNLRLLIESQSGWLRMRFYDTTNTLVLTLVSTAAVPLNQRLHMLVGWDFVTGQQTIYFNDVARGSATIIAANDLNYTDPPYQFGQHHLGFNRLDGCAADFYLNFAETLDFTVEENRRKFILADGSPAPMGPNGETPTGTTPKVFLKGDSLTFQNNLGSGGAFVQVGALTDCLTSPSPLLLEQQIVIQSDFAAFDYTIDSMLSSDGARMVMGAPTADPDAVSAAGAAWAYLRDGVDQFGDEQKLVAPDKLANDKFGHQVAMSADGTVIAVAAHEQNTTQVDGGAVYIWELIGSTWTYKYKVTPTGGVASNAKFGFSISLSDDGGTLLVGEPFRNGGGSKLGAAYIFNIIGVSPVQLAKLTHAASVNNDNLGYTVHLSGDGQVAFVGAVMTGSNGAVFVYTIGAGWSSTTETQKLVASDAAATDYFGAAVNVLLVFGGQCISSSTDGTELFIGAYGWEGGAGFDRGAAYHFRAVALVWSEIQIISAPQDDADFHFFAYSLSCNGAGDKLMIGAQSDDVGQINSGRIYLYKPDAAQYTERYNTQALVPQANAFMGNRVHLSKDGNYGVASASDYDGGATDTGATYAFAVG